MTLHGRFGRWIAAPLTARRVSALRISLLLLTAALVLAGCALLQAPALGWWLGGLLVAALGLSACGGSSSGGGGSSSSSTTPATVLSLGTLVSSNLIARFEGNSSNDEAGHSVSSAGQFDATGGRDLLIGAPGGTESSNFGAGKAYVVFQDSLTGSQSLETVTNSYLTGVRIYNGNSQGIDFGFSVGFVGNTGSFANSVIVGAPSDNAVSSNGAGYLVNASYGVSNTINVNGAFSGFYFYNASSGSQQLAVSVAGIGSIDGSDDDAILVGQPGNARAYIYLGECSAGTSSINACALSLGAILEGAGSSETGAAVAGAGNFDGSGSSTVDMVVGAPGANEAYVLQGSTGSGSYGDGCANTGFSTITVSPNMQDDSSCCSARRGFKLSGVTAGDRLGAAVAGVGDFNADGRDDILVGAPSGGAGKAYVIYGKTDTTDISLSSLTASQGFVINGETSGDQFGAAVAGGDLNNDGRPELIIGAPCAGGAGKVYVIFGGQNVGSSGSVNAADLTDSEGVVLTGEASGDKAGFSVAAVGDVDSDGVGDLLIGAPGRSSSTGAAYLVYGPELE